MRGTRKNERGASSVEYAILASLIAATIVLSVAFLGTTTSGFFNRPCEELTAGGQAC